MSNYNTPRERSREDEKILEGWTGINEDYFIETAYAKGGSLGVGIGGDYFFNLSNEQDFLRAYTNCSPLKSIISKRGKAFNTAKLKVVSAEDPKKRVNNAATKAIEKLLKKPNALQRRKQFMAQMHAYVDVFGYCPIIRMSPSAMPWEISSLWNIPPWLFDIEFTKKWLKQTEIEGIYKDVFMEWEGEKIKLNMKDVFFVFDDEIGTQKDTNLTIPDSRLVGLDYEVCNIIATMKSRNTLITKRGAVGILSNEGKDRAGVIPLEEDEKKDLQRDFKKYGIVGQPYQIIITNAALKWQQIGFATKDLQLFEEIEDDINSLCDAYGWLPQLMARGKSSSLNGNDRKEAQKMVYRDTIIPESESRLEQLAEGILAADPNTYGNLTIVADFSEVYILQEDKKILAETRQIDVLVFDKLFMMGLFTKNEILIQLGFEPKADSEFDKYYEAPEKENPGVPPKD
jgi:hypothetical protein